MRGAALIALVAARSARRSDHAGVTDETQALSALRATFPAQRSPCRSQAVPCASPSWRFSSSRCPANPCRRVPLHSSSCRSWVRI